jgi:hypothetical protein
MAFAPSFPIDGTKDDDTLSNKYSDHSARPKPATNPLPAASGTELHPNKDDSGRAHAQPLKRLDYLNGHRTTPLAPRWNVPPWRLVPAEHNATERIEDANDKRAGLKNLNETISGVSA